MNDYSKYDDLKRQCLALIAEGRLPESPTREQKIDIVYGNCKLSNPDVTREMVERAVDDAELEKDLVVLQIAFSELASEINERTEQMLALVRQYWERRK